MARRKTLPPHYRVWGSGPLGGETTYYRGTNQRAAEAAFDERAHRNYEGMGDDDEDVVIERDDRELRRFGPAIHQPTYFGRSTSRHHAMTGRHHAAKKKSSAQLDHEIAEAVATAKAREISDRRIAALTALGEDVRNTPAWRDAMSERRMINIMSGSKSHAARTSARWSSECRVDARILKCPKCNGVPPAFAKRLEALRNPAQRGESLR